MNNYNTSKDYELLWELAKTQNIISIVDEHPYIIKVKNEVGEDFKDTFINKCKSTDLEFIIPNAWISVKDRLPEDFQEVLASDGIDISASTFFRYEKDDYSFSLCQFYNEVTHWQPLPEPPKGE